MSIHVALNHVTHYRYDRRVALGPQVVRLRPAPHCRTPILSYSLRIEPAEHFINWQQDPFANYLARPVVPEKTAEFKITVDLVAQMAVYNPFDFFLEPSAENYPFSYDEGLKRELAPYLVAAPLTPKLKELVDSLPKSKQRTIDFLVGLNQRLQGDIRYVIRMEPGVQTPEQTAAPLGTRFLVVPQRIGRFLPDPLDALHVCAVRSRACQVLRDHERSATSC